MGVPIQLVKMRSAAAAAEETAQNDCLRVGMLSHATHKELLELMSPPSLSYIAKPRLKILTHRQTVARICNPSIWS